VGAFIWGPRDKKTVKGAGRGEVAGDRSVIGRQRGVVGSVGSGDRAAREVVLAVGTDLRVVRARAL
jgi:hypothetical protein